MRQTIIFLAALIGIITIYLGWSIAPAFANMHTPSQDISVNSSNFTKNLKPFNNTVQSALNTIDQLPTGGNLVAVPSSSSSPCTTPSFSYDANYYYVCSATNTWVRTPLSTWGSSALNVTYGGLLVTYGGVQVTY